MGFCGEVPMAENTRKIALSIRECASLVGVGRTFLYNEIAAGRLVAKKAGRRTIVSKNDLNDWVSKLPDMTATGSQPRRSKSLT
jgi:excisionase family DNA binding protein